MICPYCGRAGSPEDAVFCSYCGKRLEKKESARSPKRRGNGQGTVYKRGAGYTAVVTVGYWTDENGKQHRRTVSKTFEKKKDAVAALPTLAQSSSHKASKTAATFKDIYDAAVEKMTVGSGTLDCYRAAFKYFAPLHNLFAHEIDVDDLQGCIDDCPRGKRTRENMKTIAGLVYKYGIPRGYFPEKLNLAEFLKPGGEAGAGGRGLPDEYVRAISEAVGVVPGADLVTAQCYLGFRPAELLALTHEDYDAQRRLFRGGAKTEAGKNRTVTVAKKIQPIVDAYAALPGERFFTGPDGKPLSDAAYRALFYSVLDALGLDNPTVEISGMERHLYTPHSCRHVFASLMKRAVGADKDKLALIGHTSTEMLRYYQDAPVDDLRKITDQFE